VAVATHTHPAPWWDEDLETILTVLEIFQEQAAEVDKAKRRR
jgi:hypothetical protein